MDVALYYLLDFQPASCNRPSYSKVDSLSDGRSTHLLYHRHPMMRYSEEQQGSLYTLEGITPAIEGSLRDSFTTISVK